MDAWWHRRHPALAGLEFQKGVRRQERINWQVRCAEGDLGPDENDRLSRALTSPRICLSDDERKDWAGRLDRVAFVSDGALPFRDNVDEARRHGVDYIAEPGGSIRSADVMAACREHSISLVQTGRRLFHH